MPLTRAVLEQQLPHTLSEIHLSKLGNRISGKVRDSYVLGSQRILVTSDRLSAFDRILTTIPFKGQILNRMASYWFRETKHLVPNHIIAEPHPNVFVAKNVEIVPIEVVVRGYLAGSAWRDYQAGRPVSGVELPKGMKKSQRFDWPLLTPSTKAEQGKHDEPISSREVIRQGLVEESLWQEISEYALRLFEFGSTRASEHGLILVDTKYEFGLLHGPGGKREVLLADEIHTSDSSRYWIKDSYNSRFDSGEDPDMLDKEFVRRWLMEQGYMGEGTPPDFPDSFRIEVAERYIDACERITGEAFHGIPGDANTSIESALEKFLL